MKGLEGYIPNFLFILLRAGIFISLFPFFSSKAIPAQFKIGFAIAIAIILTPIVDFKIGDGNVVMSVINEILFAMVLGLSVRFAFFAVDMAGQIMSNSMGLSAATIFNPEIGHSTDISRLYSMTAMLLFFVFDAHHDMLYILAKGYEIIPAGDANIKNLMAEGIGIISSIFIMAVKIAAPVVVGMLIANLLFGYISKAAPQMNILFISFPVYIALGFLIMFLSVPVFVNVFNIYIGDVKAEVARIFSIAQH